MAKDGTMRGGARPGSGPKRKALTEKISAGKTATVIEPAGCVRTHGCGYAPCEGLHEKQSRKAGQICVRKKSSGKHGTG